jgi:hypothetical protein
VAKRRRVEVATTGIDESFQGLTSDPVGKALPQGTGLRIPPVLPSYTTPKAQPRYLFCLATRTITSGRTRLLDVRQLVTLGVDANYGTPPERPVEMTVVSPSFHFPDGNISWHLVTERVGQRPTVLSTTDAAGWQYLQTDGSAMLYKTFVNSTITGTGAPVYYFQGLTSYEPPELAQSWLDINGLETMHELRFPWYGRQWGSVDSVIEGTARISLYASVLQTNPATRTPLVPPSPWLSSSTTPEELFVYDWTKTSEASPTQGPIYWRIAGSLVFEDGDDVRDLDAHGGHSVGGTQ